MLKLVSFAFIFILLSSCNISEKKFFKNEIKTKFYNGEKVKSKWHAHNQRSFVDSLYREKPRDEFYSFYRSFLTDSPNVYFNLYGVESYTYYIEKVENDTAKVIQWYLWDNNQKRLIGTKKPPKSI